MKSRESLLNCAVLGCVHRLQISDFTISFLLNGYSFVIRALATRQSVCRLFKLKNKGSGGGEKKDRNLNPNTLREKVSHPRVDLKGV